MKILAICFENHVTPKFGLKIALFEPHRAAVSLGISSWIDRTLLFRQWRRTITGANQASSHLLIGILSLRIPGSRHRLPRPRSTLVTDMNNTSGSQPVHEPESAFGAS